MTFSQILICIYLYKKSNVSIGIGSFIYATFYSFVGSSLNSNNNTSFLFTSKQYISGSIQINIKIQKLYVHNC